ncbi:MAG: UDP-N-acetylmuramoyl-L-alanine--D-glutamate ligase [Cyanobacterium sp. T60_A2020_053]|nr:UDP-N-acetylmuramoyl-L-alanine--D-glutamate ligase [Cyanobacterium sp. T60_A2020_053]
MTKVGIIGVGKSGIAAARLLRHQGHEVTIYDTANTETLQRLRDNLAEEMITVQLSSHLPLTSALRPSLIVVSPGVPWDIPLLQEARKQGIETIGEMELAWRHLNSIPWVGITGTNGKTTTTALVEAMFQGDGINISACGNIGYAGCELALASQTHPPKWVVAEISSYQIESSAELSPRIGIWTTFTPDHLARHRTLENYFNIKASLLQRSRHKIINADDPYLLKSIVNKSWSNVYWTSTKGKSHLPCSPNQGVFLEDSWIVAFGELIAPISLFKMVGQHNQQNLLMAVGATILAGVSKTAIVNTISTFTGVAHRLELIKTIHGVDYINDSKATNYDAAEVGLNAVASPVILIAGGEAKEGDDSAWISKIKEKCAFVLLIGDAGDLFASRLQAHGVNNFQIVGSMEGAVTNAPALAEKYQAKVVLLSPACASFDQYRSFEHRGDDFRHLVNSI